jgi:hypothetical protein
LIARWSGVPTGDFCDAACGHILIVNTIGMCPVPKLVRWWRKVEAESKKS